MNALVAAGHDEVTHTRDADLMSPELVLVDPVLAAVARLRLAEQRDTLEVLERKALPSSALPRPRAVRIEFEEPPAVAVAPVSERADVSRNRPGSLRLLATLAGASIAVLLLLDVHVEVGKTPASAGEALVEQPPTTPRVEESDGGEGARPPVPSTPTERPAAPQPRRFAWAPVPGATAYYIELFRGENRVFAATTRRPQLSIPAQWKYEGKKRSLAPGDYRWYVWSVTAGTRATSAIVQAQLVVPAG